MASALRRVRSATIVDVAAAAGVSMSTVSRVIREHPDVGDKTRERVLALIEELGYRPSTLARALASGRSQTIGLLVSDIANPFYPRLAKAIELECRKHHYSLVICNTDDVVQETVDYVQRLTDQGVDGLIHASVGNDEEAVIETLGDTSRIVFANRRPRSASVSYVVSDNKTGGRQLGDHLVAMGHRRIGFVAGPSWASSVEDRLHGLREAVSVRGGQVMVIEGDFAPSNDLEAIRTWLALPTPPTAIVAINDRVGVGVYGAVLDLGLKVPEDIAVAGFDNLDFGWSRLLSLTSVGQRIEVMGRRAVEILLRQLATPSTRVTHTVLPMDLVVRATTSNADVSG